jgi:hypothetical protein
MTTDACEVLGRLGGREEEGMGRHREHSRGTRKPRTGRRRGCGDPLQRAGWRWRGRWTTRRSYVWGVRKWKSEGLREVRDLVDR